MAEDLKQAIHLLDEAMEAACELPKKYFNQDDYLTMMALSEKLHSVFLDNRAA